VGSLTETSDRFQEVLHLWSVLDTKFPEVPYLRSVLGGFQEVPYLWSILGGEEVPYL
jgi:hypothetical protein